MAPSGLSGRRPKVFSMRILLVTDAWRPQINGVVRALETTAEVAKGLGIEIAFLTPEPFPTVPIPTYPEIRLSLAKRSKISRMIEDARADYVHISTEGPLGHHARGVCLKEGRRFTTSFHTKLPEYLAVRRLMPSRVTYAYLRSFHNAAAGVMVSNASLEEELARNGFRNLMRWQRGVDCDAFRPLHEQVDPPGDALLGDLPHPVHLYVGRVAVEKNLEAFLDLDLPGTKVVTGQGPQLEALRAAYRDVVFTGPRSGAALAATYASADVFVFPSLTDTLGLVCLEAMASGVPVAAYPVTGPRDIIGPGGAVDEDLRAAIARALAVSPEAARAQALTFTWEKATRQFVDNVLVANGAARLAA